MIIYKLVKRGDEFESANGLEHVADDVQVGANWDAEIDIAPSRSTTGPAVGQTERLEQIAIQLILLAPLIGCAQLVIDPEIDPLIGDDVQALTAVIR